MVTRFRTGERWVLLASELDTSMSLDAAVLEVCRNADHTK